MVVFRKCDEGTCHVPQLWVGCYLSSFVSMASALRVLKSVLDSRAAEPTKVELKLPNPRIVMGLSA